MTERNERDFKDILDDGDVSSSNFSKKRLRPSNADEETTRLKKLKIEDDQSHIVSVVSDTAN